LVLKVTSDKIGYFVTRISGEEHNFGDSKSSIRTGVIAEPRTFFYLGHW